MALLDQHVVDVVGLQELQRSQYGELIRLAGRRYDAYFPPGDTENAIPRRRDRWGAAAGTDPRDSYFDGHSRLMPIVTLRARGSGRRITVINVHNPADTKACGRMQDRGRSSDDDCRVVMSRASRPGASTGSVRRDGTPGCLPCSATSPQCAKG